MNKKFGQKMKNKFIGLFSKGNDKKKEGDKITAVPHL